MSFLKTVLATANNDSLKHACLVLMLTTCDFNDRESCLPSGVGVMVPNAGACLKCHVKFSYRRLRYSSCVF